MPLAVSFVVTLLCVPYWIRRARKAELVGRDMHKSDRRTVEEIGGVPVLVGFLAGAFTYIAITTFYLNIVSVNYKIFAILTTLLLVALIGLIDDILGWKIGLRQWQKPALTLFAALPLMVVNAGYSEIGLPFLGNVQLSYLYPLFFIPLGIVGASNGFNMIGGYNGLEAGMGALILSTLGLIAYLSGQGWLAILALCMVAAVVAFLLFNWYPARIFPGNSFTYFVGALIACVAIMGNMEKLALLMFIPYLIEFILKARGFMQKESFAQLLFDGTLALPYDKWYGIEHISISFLKSVFSKATEVSVVLLILFFEFIICIIAFLIYYFSIGIF